MYNIQIKAIIKTNYITITFIYPREFVECGYANMRQSSFQKQYLMDYANIQKAFHNLFPRAWNKLFYQLW